MKPLTSLLPLLLILLAFQAGCAHRRLEPGFYSTFSTDGKPTTDRVHKLQASADRVLSYDDGERFDLGLGGVVKGDGAFPVMRETPITFKFDQIGYFLQNERHKNLVVVEFGKSVMRNDEPVIRREVEKVTGWMRQAGYRRIVILGMHSSGTHCLADTSL
ncbi:MAG: hypothetical protein EOP86_20445 [Verrucomicrobiaceae bacterium]|nr:MAG: hypothetical protein EOP86_20445 [Verrucomicrobiaceae bacterium]